jgi:hypothetical protein
MRALIIDEPWISAILRGEKIWEMRKRNCKVRGPIALIRKGSGHVVGVAELVDSLQVLTTPQAYADAEPKHRIPPERQASAFRDGWVTPWVIASARPLRRPVPYSHPSGAVIWVTLAPDVAAAVNGQTE